MNYSQIASDEAIKETITNLAAHGITAVVADTKEQAKEKVLEMIPKNSSVMTMTSVTLDQTGIAEAINDNPDYVSIRKQLMTMDRATEGRKMQILGASPEYAIGSVHAVTRDGSMVIASNTGSQLPAEAYGSSHVIFVVGAQKIVNDLDAAMKRLYDYVLPLESERAHKAYGVPGSFVSKILIIHKEINPTRMQVVIVKEALGF